jgi:WD40 repeat protein
MLNLHIYDVFLACRNLLIASAKSSKALKALSMHYYSLATVVYWSAQVMSFAPDFHHVLKKFAGDDGCVTVWNTDNFKCEQVLHNGKWGQVTALTWISTDAPGNSICIGTGRGLICVCPILNESTVCTVFPAMLHYPHPLL